MTALIEFLVALFVLGVLAALGYWVGVLVPQRRQFKVEMRQARVDRNHQDLFLFVSELLTIHDRGYMVVFPDEETLTKARALTQKYKEDNTK